MTRYRFRDAAIAVLVCCAAPALPAAGELTQVPGVTNFHKVDDHVYRGGQPSAVGLRSLARLGIKTDLDLRGGVKKADKEKKDAEAAGIRYVNIPMSTNAAPTRREMERAQALLNDPSAWPVFVHCASGTERTGAVVACYRISHDHWTNKKALNEARRDGMTRTVEESYVRSYRDQGSSDQKRAASARSREH